MKYVFVIGPYDSTAVGPFTSDQELEDFRANLPVQFDANIWSQSDLDDNVLEYGPIELVAPTAYHPRPRIIELQGKYIAQTHDWEGPGRPDYAAALADLRDRLG